MQDLKKSKYVLEYRNMNLVNQVTPKDELIAQQQDQIRDMESSFEQLKQQREVMQQMIKDLKTRNKGHDAEISSLRQRIREQELTKSRFKHDLQQVLDNFQNPKLLKVFFCVLTVLFWGFPWRGGL